jgi:hypothetical protein
MLADRAQFLRFASSRLIPSRLQAEGDDVFDQFPSGRLLLLTSRKINDFGFLLHVRRLAALSGLSCLFIWLAVWSRFFFHCGQFFFGLLRQYLKGPASLHIVQKLVPAFIARLMHYDDVIEEYSYLDSANWALHTDLILRLCYCPLFFGLQGFS